MTDCLLAALDSDRSVCMAATCYSCQNLAVPTNKQVFNKKRTGAKFQIEISKTEGLVRGYTNRRTDGHG